jgi:hypothetical protein
MRTAFLEALRCRVELGGGTNVPPPKRITLPTGTVELARVAQVLRAINKESEAKS